MASVRQTDVDNDRAAVQAVVLDVLRRRAAGESLSDKQVIAARPDLAEQLRVELAKLQRICAAGMDAAHLDGAGATVTIDLHDERTPGMLQLQCPHCREPFETETDTPLIEIVCSTCGGQFSLAGHDQETRFAPSLKSLAHFDLIERLGVGGFGTVWKARDRKLDRTVAVKIPRQGLLNNEDLEKFLREARAAAQLQHPSIVHVHEVGRDGDSVFIVSDFVRGIPLSEWLSGQQPTMRQAAELCVAIAEALQHAHDRGVIHRDLKPANILIDGDGRPHLMDFGLARREVGEVTVTLDGQVLGTTAYMSPEQAQGEAHTADARSDVYSLGVILFQLLTGELPFRGSARMLMHQVIHEEPPSPRKFNARIPRDLETIALKCIEKDPSRRYRTARAVASDLERYLGDQPIEASGPSLLYRISKYTRRNRKTVALSSLAALTLIAGTVVSSWQALRATRAEREQSALRELAEKGRLLESKLRQASEAKAKLAQARILLYNAHDVAESENLLNGLAPEFVQPDHDHAQLRRSLGAWHAIHDQWGPAAANFRVLLLVDTLDGDVAMTFDQLLCGPAFIASGGDAAYEEFRRAAISRFRNTAEPFVAERITRATLLRPADDEVMISLAPLRAVLLQAEENSSPNADQTQWTRVALALSDYRAANYKDAVEWGKKVLASKWKHRHGLSGVQAILAMAYFRLNQAANARAALAEGRKHNEEADLWATSRVLQVPWWVINLQDGLNMRTLLVEADALIEGRPIAGPQGYVASQYTLGRMYSVGFADPQGLLFAKNPAVAVKWFRLAAEQGHAASQYYMGYSFTEGLGVDKNPAEAVRWLCRSADQGYVDAMNSAAWLLATCPDAAVRDSAKAEKYEEEAVAATNRKDPATLDTLAAAYAEAGKFAEAIAAQNEAIALEKDVESKADFKSRRKSYESNLPYRER
jgi:serine/threonine protein kinase/TPR repeat protein